MQVLPRQIAHRFLKHLPVPMNQRFFGGAVVVQFFKEFFKTVIV